MSTAKRIFLLVFLAFANAMGLALIGMLIDDGRFMLFGAVVFMLFAIVLYNTRCPRCHKRITVRTVSVGGVKWTVSFPSRFDKCPHCGLDLTLERGGKAGL